MTTVPSEAAGQDQFKKLTNHRVGYGDRLAWLLDWLKRHPDATLSSGEGAVLYDYIQKLEQALKPTKANLPDLETTP